MKQIKSSLDIRLIVIIAVIIVLGIIGTIFIIKLDEKSHKEQNNIIESVQMTNTTTKLVVTTKNTTTTKITTTKPVTTKAKKTTTTAKTTKKENNNSGRTFDITFTADEIISEAGVTLGGHVGVAVLSNLTCNNGHASIETEKIYIYDNLIRVTVTGASAGSVTISGTITSYGLDMYEGETVSYPDSSGTFIITRPIGDINAILDEEPPNNISAVNNRRRQINCHGGTVAGFTTSYVCEGGACSTVRKSLGNTWHVTAKNTYYSYGITWYELWDTDDGDYYGWVDEDYIDFY